MIKLVSIVCFVLLSLHYQCQGSKDVEKRLGEEEIVPDVLQGLNDSVELLKVYWDDETKADLGNILTPTQVQDQPVVDYAGDKDSFYTLTMQDPDAPSRREPSRREFRHWLIVNIPGSEITKGDTVFDYIGSGPPEVTNLKSPLTYNLYFH